MDEDGER